MNVSRLNHALASFSRKERQLIGQIDRHRREKKTKEQKLHCSKENPCWDCVKCVPGRYT